MKFNFIIVLFALLGGCNRGATVSINDYKFSVEVADTDQTRQQGLMYRESMANNAGMLFIFPRQRIQAFWMENTLIPLDIIYFDKNLKLVSIQKNRQPCRLPDRTSAALKGLIYTPCPSYTSEKPAKYVLEINAGLADKYHFKQGDELLLMLKK
ncbi:MAG TPA: DUF192 domain-containing protein [Oceanospirillales bacterium]|nr:DUF192 domain-containing protein [Oceanospirillales bacterium]